MAPSKVKHPSFKRDSHARRGEGVPPKALSLLGMILILSSLLPFRLSAQTIVPNRDIQSVDSLNRGKPATAPVTVLKRGYAMISRADGHYYHTYLPDYLMDSIDIALGGGDQIFYKFGTTDPPVAADDSVETIGPKYIRFNGLIDTLDTYIEILPTGAISFQKGDSGENDYYNWLILRDMQTDQGNVPWYSWVGSTAFESDSQRNMTLTQGFNLSGAGGAVEPGVPAWGESWEYHFAQSISDHYVEWHRMYVDSSGVQHRIESIVLDKGNFEDWYKYYTLHRWFLLDPINNQPYLDMFRDADNGANIRMTGSASGDGADIYVNGEAGNMQILSHGINAPELYLFKNTDTSYTHVGFLDWVPTGAASVSIPGVDASGYATNTTLGSSLSLSGGTLNTSAAATSKWTDGGSYLYPTANEAIHIPSYNSSATGNLNIIGSIDQMYPISSLSNIAIGRGVGNGSLSGSGNIYLGNYAGLDNLTGDRNILMGYAAGENFTGSNAIAIGYQALQTNISGTGCLAIGDRALKTTTASNNMALGNQALQKTTTGSGNLGIGNIALVENTTGADNVAIGNNSGQNGNGSSNVFIGKNAALGGSGNTASSNVVIGTGAGEALTGSENVMIGASAGAQNTSSGYNVFIGSVAGYNNVSGSGNVFIGSQAGYNETGSNKLYVDNSTTSSPLIKGDFGANTVMINGKSGFTNQGGGAVYIGGIDASNYHTRLTPGPGISITDNVLSVTPTGQDSVFISGDSICVIDILGDTVCVNQDSFYLTDTTVCYIVMGDTSCVSFSPSGGNIYNTNGALTDNRTVSMNTHSLRFSHGSPYGELRLSQTGVYPFMSLDAQAGITNNTSPMLSLSGSNQSDIYVHFNGLSNEDYCLGQDKSEDTFVFGGGDNLTDEPMISLSRARDSIIIYKDMQLDAGLIDGGGDIGGAGQVLTSTGTETNWVSPVNLNVPISGLIAALGSNSIDNANYTQTWQWNSLGAASGLKLSSTSTAAASNSQKLFEALMSGANVTSNQTTYGGYFSNTHTGSFSSNYGVVGIASGGSTWNAGVAGTSSGTNGFGVTGSSSSTSGAGVRGSTNATSNGWGVYAYSTDTDSQPLIAESEASGTTGVVGLATLQRRGSNNPAPGFGGSLNFTNTIRNLVPATTNTLASTWADTTYATRYSRLTITGVGDGSATDIIYFEGDKRTRFNGRAETAQGADVASVAGAITLGGDGNVFEITGTNAITLISNVGWQNGSQIILLFTSTATLTDGTANSGTDIGMELDGNTNFTGSAGYVVTLVLSEIGGTQRWREVSRSVN